MRIFLTGATGYVGSSILEASLRAGHSVTALVRDPEKAEHVTLRGGRPIVGELGKPTGYVTAAEESAATGQWQKIEPVAGTTASRITAG